MPAQHVGLIKRGSANFFYLSLLIFAERVCDTVYDTDESKKDEFACVNVVNPVCKDVDQTIYDKVLLPGIFSGFFGGGGEGLSCDSGCETFSFFSRLAARPLSSTAAATILNTAAILDLVVTALRTRTTASELIQPPATILPGHKNFRISFWCWLRMIYVDGELYIIFMVYLTSVNTRLLLQGRQQ